MRFYCEAMGNVRGATESTTMHVRGRVVVVYNNLLVTLVTQKIVVDRPL